MTPRPGEDPYADLPPIDIVVPDDPRELALEAEALRRERRAEARRRALRMFQTRRWRRYGLSGPLVFAVLSLVAVLTGLLTLLVPSRPNRMAPRPLATAVPAPPGTPPGRLPDVMLRMAGRTRSAVDLRPGIVAMLPTGCACADTVRMVVDTAQEFGLLSVLVTGPDGEEQANTLARGPGRGVAAVAVDPDHGLAAAYAPKGVTVLLVRPDGTVSHIVREVGGGQQLEPLVQEMVSDPASRPAG